MNREIIRQALGIVNGNPPYKNYYCAKTGDPECEAMVNGGFLIRGNQINDGRDQNYIVTPKGMAAIEELKPHAITVPETTDPNEATHSPRLPAHGD